MVYKLALDAGIHMSECKVQSIGSPHHIFLTKRFDRTDNGKRLQFTSAMTQLEYFDGNDDGASYLELAEFLIQNGSNTKEDLRQLWTRILFNIMVSNSDDHLRNHGFIFDNAGWCLSPAYDINPTLNASGLHLNIDDKDNALDVNLAFEVALYFQLEPAESQQIYKKVSNAVSNWDKVAKDVGIARGERDLMGDCFQVGEY